MSNLAMIKSSLRRVKDSVIRERLLMVQAAYKEPLRNVGKSFGCTHGKVDYWKKRYDKYGLKGLYTKTRSGRPAKITEEQAKEIRKIVRNHDVKRGWRTSHIRNVIYEKAGVKYSVRQVIRISQSWGLSKIKPRPRYAFSKKEDRADFIKKTVGT
ncbi:hypothetical protein FJZ53_07120 [Candidatus Woesearchaeota archaeon]|nr:hypothetical protein [Candidatus Woesearchaeota archaeon]